MNTLITLPTILDSTTNILSETWGNPIKVTGVIRFTDGSPKRSRVFRASLTGVPAGMPDTVIIKCTQGLNGRAYDPTDFRWMRSAWRLYNEWAGPLFLRRLAFDPPLAPLLYGADPEIGIVILENLGDGACLADLLLGYNAADAKTYLLEYAKTIGRLQALTVGQSMEFSKLCVSLGGSPSTNPPAVSLIGHIAHRGVQSLCNELGVAYRADAEKDINKVIKNLSGNKSFCAFSPSEPCPRQHRLISGRFRLFDFEACGFQHALIDGVYGRMYFPSCWCVGQIPQDVVVGMEKIYREELQNGCPQAKEDIQFYRAVVEGCAFWALKKAVRGVQDVWGGDRRGGIMTMRQKHILWLTAFADATERFGYLEALGDTLRQVALRLREQWRIVEPLPLYPVFQNQ